MARILVNSEQNSQTALSEHDNSPSIIGISISIPVVATCIQTQYELCASCFLNYLIESEKYFDFDACDLFAEEQRVWIYLAQQIICPKQHHSGEKIKQITSNLHPDDNTTMTDIVHFSTFENDSIIRKFQKICLPKFLTGSKSSELVLNQQDISNCVFSDKRMNILYLFISELVSIDKLSIMFERFAILYEKGVKGLTGDLQQSCCSQTHSKQPLNSLIANDVLFNKLAIQPDNNKNIIFLAPMASQASKRNNALKILSKLGSFQDAGKTNGRSASLDDHGPRNGKTTKTYWEVLHDDLQFSRTKK